MDVQICTDGQVWDAALEQWPEARWCDRDAYRRAVVQTFGHAPHYLLARRGEETVGALPLFAVTSRLFGRMLVSLPFVDYGGIHATDAEAEEALWQEALRLAKQLRMDSIELRQVCPARLPMSPSLDKVNPVLPLGGSADEMWRGLSSRLRNHLRKAEKSGFAVRRGGVECVGAFYAVWSHNMRDLGTPAYPPSFFVNFLSAFGEQAEILILEMDARPVGAALAVFDRARMEVPWASSLRDSFHLRPNDWLYWQAILRGVERGCREFHFGRSTVNSTHHDFKRQWGTFDQPLYYYAHARRGAAPDLDSHNGKYRLAVRAWQRLPVALANRLAPFIIRGIP